MSLSCLTGNQAAGRVLAAAGEANRFARGCGGGVYPITPQTEIVEYLAGYEFAKGRMVMVESEHSAMGVCIGAAMTGARAFTASASNGLIYMAENVYAAGYFRLPIVMVVSNRTVGPPWNIWVDQGDSLALRDAAWIQLYCDSHQDFVDTILLAFRVCEDGRVLLPALVAQDGFLLSHTQMVVDMPEQRAVDEYLRPLRLPHQLSFDAPKTYGGMTRPRDTARHRADIQAAMERVPEVLDEALDEFQAVFGRRPQAAFSTYLCDDADTVVVASGTMANTVREVVKDRRARGERVGLVNAKLFRPFAREVFTRAIGPAHRLAVLDRNHSPGSGGIFWSEVAASLCGSREYLAQGYIVGLAGGDVSTPMIDWVLNDLGSRSNSTAPIFVTEVCR